MDVSRVNKGLLIAGAAGALLIIFMFFSWFAVTGVSGGGIEFSGADLTSLAGGDVGASAWDAFSFIDILLLLAGLVAVGVAAASAAGALPRLPVAASVLVAAVGGLAVVLIVFRIIFPPTGGEVPDGIEVDIGREIGVFLGLLAAAGILGGGLSAMRDEGTTFGGEADRLRSSGSGPGSGTTTGPGTTTGGPSSTTPPPAPERRPGGGPPAS